MASEEYQRRYPDVTWVTTESDIDNEINRYLHDDPQLLLKSLSVTSVVVSRHNNGVSDRVELHYTLVLEVLNG